MRTTASRSRAPRRIILSAALAVAAVVPNVASATTYSAVTQATPQNYVTLDAAACTQTPTTGCIAVGSSAATLGSNRAGSAAASAGGLTNYSLGYPFPGSTPANLVSESPLGVTCETASCVTVGTTERSGSLFDGFSVGHPRANWSSSGPWSGVWAPSGALSSRLRAVSCASTTTCVAVGDYVDSSSVTRGYALVKTSATSTIATTVPGAGTSTLSGVECETVHGTCTIIGTVAGAPVVKSLDPATSTWSAPTVTGMPATATLRGVSCKVHRCFIVGSYPSSGTTLPLTLVGHFTYSGTPSVAWTTAGSTVPSLPVGATSLVFNSVTCISDTQCRAVGGVTSSGTTLPYSASFLSPGGGSAPGDVAGTWTGHSNPVGAGLASGTLNATSCGVSFCLDAGTATVSGSNTAPIAAKVAVTD